MHCLDLVPVTIARVNTSLLTPRPKRTQVAGFIYKISTSLAWNWQLPRNAFTGIILTDVLK